MTTRAEKKAKVRVLVNLKYDKEVKKIGQELEIRESDLKNMVNKKLVKPIK